MIGWSILSLHWIILPWSDIISLHRYVFFMAIVKRIFALNCVIKRVITWHTEKWLIYNFKIYRYVQKLLKSCKPPTCLQWRFLLSKDMHPEVWTVKSNVSREKNILWCFPYLTERPFADPLYAYTEKSENVLESNKNEMMIAL